jgi:PhnB protein
MMKKTVNPIPAGYHTATPYLVVRDAAAAIEFYKHAFGATETVRLARPDGKIMHAEIKIGDSPIMLTEESPSCNSRSATTLGGSPVSIMLYVKDVDALSVQAIRAGAKVTRPVENQFYGDRAGTFTDPFGLTWTLATHQEDLSLEEIRRRAMDFITDMPVQNAA